MAHFLQNPQQYADVYKQKDMESEQSESIADPYYSKNEAKYLASTNHLNSTNSIVQNKTSQDKKDNALQRKTENETNSSVDAIPATISSLKQQKMVQRKEQEEDIRQNKPKGMNTATYLKLSDP